MSFANLKKQSSLGSLTEKLVKEVEKGKPTADEMMGTETFSDVFYTPILWAVLHESKAGMGLALTRIFVAGSGKVGPEAAEDLAEMLLSHNISEQEIRMIMKHPPVRSWLDRQAKGHMPQVHGAIMPAATGVAAHPGQDPNYEAPTQ